MSSRDFFLDLMNSLDVAFLVRQGAGSRQPNGWGERFFQKLSLNHPEWNGQRLQIYIKASEILHHFAFSERADEMVPVFFNKPEALLRMVLMLLQNEDLFVSNASTKRAKTGE